MIQYNQNLIKDSKASLKEKFYKMKLNLVLAVFSLINLSISFIIINKYSVKGYELSFYASLPVYVWVSIVLGIISGIMIFVIQIHTNKERNYLWLWGFIILAFFYSLITVIPPLRCYYLYGRGDILSHAGKIKDIMFNGHFVAEENYYPIIHIFVAQVAKLLNLDFVTVMNYIPVLFAVIYMLGIYFLSTIVMLNYGQVLMTTVSGTFLIPWGNISLGTRYGIFPTSLLVLLIPLVLFFYFKKNDYRFLVLLFIMLLMFPFFHPLVSIILCLWLFSIEVFMWLYNKFLNKKNLSEKKNVVMTHTSLAPPFFLFIIWFSWVSSREDIFAKPLKSLYSWLQGELVYGSRAALMEESLSKLEMRWFDVLILGLKMFGDHLIYAILSGIALILIIKNVRKNPNLFFDLKIKRLCTFILFFIFSIMLLLFLLPQNLGFTPLRTLGFMSICSTILGGFALHEVFIKKGIQYKLLVGLILAITALIGIFHTYNSPYTRRLNDQVTKMQFESFNWAYNYSDHKTAFVNFSTTRGETFANAVLGYEERRKRKDIPKGYWVKDYYVPDHFNYSFNNTLGESFNTDKYFLLSKVDILAYTELWPQINRFNRDDFFRLSYDTSVDKIYSNGESETWHVRAYVK